MTVKLNDKAKQVVAAVAPIIGASFGGPLGAMAGKVLSGVLGTDDEKEVQEMILSGSPDAIAKVRVAEIEFKRRCEELEIDVLKLDAADRASAREREVKANDTTTPRTLAYVVVGSWMILNLALLFIVLDSSMRDVVFRMLGTFDAAVMCVLYYYYGSSAGSKQKTDALTK